MFSVSENTDYNALFAEEMNDIGVVGINIFAQADIARPVQGELFAAQENDLPANGAHKSTVGALVAEDKFSAAVFQLRFCLNNRYANEC